MRKAVQIDQSIQRQKMEKKVVINEGSEERTRTSEDMSKADCVYRRILADTSIQRG